MGIEWTDGIYSPLKPQESELRKHGAHEVPSCNWVIVTGTHGYLRGGFFTSNPA